MLGAGFFLWSRTIWLLLALRLLTLALDNPVYSVSHIFVYSWDFLMILLFLLWLFYFVVRHFNCRVRQTHLRCANRLLRCATNDLVVRQMIFFFTCAVRDATHLPCATYRSLKGLLRCAFQLTRYLRCARTSDTFIACEQYYFSYLCSCDMASPRA